MTKSAKTLEGKGERFGRAKKPTAPEIIEILQEKTKPKSPSIASYYCQIRVHRAHVVMLTEQGILSKEEGARILKGIKEVEKLAKTDDSLKSYMSTEKALIDKIGEVGGKMHIGRSRNDLAQAQRRMFLRDQIQRIIKTIIDFQKILIDKADENTNTVMSGYTHWRQAQPITLGHYLMAHVDAAGRSIQRLENLYERTNMNPLGSAALAGTGWPIDRIRTKTLLGFDKLIENSYDCVATYDYVFELASSIAIHMSNLSRLAEDIQIWSSDEFAMIDLDEAYAGTSSIMPQKKNPSSLEMVKRFASESIGALVATITSIKGISYTHIGDRTELEPLMVELAIGSSKIMAGVISTLTPMKEIMLMKVSKGFSTMTELADTLVRNCGISFREAHDIIAITTMQAISEGKTADQITNKMMEDASLLCIDRKLDLSKADLQLALSPLENVKRRKVIGGPAPIEVKRMIDDRRKRVDEQIYSCNKRLQNLDKANEELMKAENQIISCARAQRKEI